MTLMQQQRLIGISLLLLLIGIVALLLIDNASDTLTAQDEQKVEEQQDFASLIEPVEQDIEVIEVAEEALVDPQKLGLPEQKVVEPKQKSQPIVEEKPKKTMAKVQEKASSVSNDDKESWLVQLASFSVKSNADALAEKVNKLGYNAHVEATKSGNKAIYRVRLAAESNKTSVQAKAASLKQSLQLNPQVLKVSN